MGAHVYWRILITEVFTPATGFADVVNFGELIMRTTDQGPNVVAGGTAINYFNQGSGRPADRAFDRGVDNVFYWSADWRNLLPVGVGYQFAQEVTIGQIRLCMSDSTNYGVFPKSFKIQSSDNGTTWADELVITNAPEWYFVEQREYNLPGLVTIPITLSKAGVNVQEGFNAPVTLAKAGVNVAETAVEKIHLSKAGINAVEMLDHVTPAVMITKTGVNVVTILRPTPPRQDIVEAYRNPVVKATPIN